MTTRIRIVLVAAVSVLALVGAGVYVAVVRSGQKAASSGAAAVPTRSTGTVTGPRIVFRNTALGEGYGHVAMVPLADPGGPRAITPAECDRVYASDASAVCLAARRGLVTTFQSQVLSADFTPVRDLPLTGLPSRARISRDGTLVATTTFVYGDSYANPGQFSTRTVVSRTDGSSSLDLEQFALTVNGSTVTATDRNLWGVTFVDDDHFYATAASGGRTWLVRGSLAERRLTSVHADVECPSLSPDGTRVAYKKHGTLPSGRWRLAVLDLASGRETQLAEVRSVDDQADWLDNTHVIYGLPRATEGTASSDIWVVPSDGTGTPSVLIPDAWSPAVIR